MLNMLTRSSRRGVMAVLIATLPWCASPRAVAGDKLPTGEKVMDTFIKNSGGKRAYRRIKNRVFKMRMDTPGGSITMTVHEAPPNKSYTEIETPMGTMKQGTDGHVVWRETPMGPQLVTGSERDRELQDAMFLADLEWRKIYTKVVCEEITEYAGESCYRVSLTPKSGKTETRYYAVDTGLKVGTERTINHPMMGEMEMTIRSEEYKEVDGILYPHKLVRVMGGQEGAIIIESIEHNVDMPKDRFALPEAIAKLVADEKATKNTGDAPKDQDKGRDK